LTSVGLLFESNLGAALTTATPVKSVAVPATQATAFTCSLVTWNLGVPPDGSRVSVIYLSLFLASSGVGAPSRERAPSLVRSLSGHRPPPRGADIARRPPDEGAWMWTVKVLDLVF
jgi:hypothetical protein